MMFSPFVCDAFVVRLALQLCQHFYIANLIDNICANTVRCLQERVRRAIEREPRADARTSSASAGAY